MITPCSCGCNEAHEIARRRTFDGKIVCFWSDGAVTYAFGFRVTGAGVARWRHVREANVRAAWIVADLVGLYESAEVSRLVEVARREVRKAGHCDTAAIVQNVRHAMESQRQS